MSQSGTVPSKLVFLSNLPALRDRDKVRFLGCVEKYDIYSDQLILIHRYPPCSPSITAHVDISLVREIIKPDLLVTGAWLNVVGYLTKENLLSGESRGDTATAQVQAIMLWNTIAFNLPDYETSVQARIDAGTTG